VKHRAELEHIRLYTGSPPAQPGTAGESGPASPAG
jgi:hypothetical protein